jgi:limonene-1,2-epoxide hydrolase
VSSATETVRAFVGAWSQGDLDAIMDFFAPDCVYHNIPVEPVRGTAAIRAVIEGFTGMATEMDWVLHHVAESVSGVVLTERLDRFRLADGRWLELPVMGAFELREGKISAWRDYFDMGQFQRQLPKTG